MKKKTELSKEDIELFRQTVEKTKPIDKDSLSARASGKPGQTSSRRVSSVVSNPVGPEDKLTYARSGLQDKIIRKLRQGKFDIDSRLDLHGMTHELAQDQLAAFFSRCIGNGHRCVLLIHGKGYRSGEKIPVLKNLVNRWLREQDYVRAFCSARPRDGGAGAVYVLV